MRLRLKELRIRRALTQEELAARAGVSKVTIVKLEKPSHTAPVHPSTLRKLARALEIEPSELWEDER